MLMIIYHTMARIPQKSSELVFIPATVYPLKNNKRTPANRSSWQLFKNVIEAVNMLLQSSICFCIFFRLFFDVLHFFEHFFQPAMQCFMSGSLHLTLRNKSVYAALH